MLSVDLPILREVQNVLQVLRVLLGVAALALAAIEPDGADDEHNDRQCDGEPTTCTDIRQLGTALPILSTPGLGFVAARRQVVSFYLK